jgi:hypothetical protein
MASVLRPAPCAVMRSRALALGSSATNTYGAFGVLGTALPKIGIFLSSSREINHTRAKPASNTKQLDSKNKSNFLLF